MHHVRRKEVIMLIIVVVIITMSISYAAIFIFFRQLLSCPGTSKKARSNARSYFSGLAAVSSARSTTVQDSTRLIIACPQVPCPEEDWHVANVWVQISAQGIPQKKRMA